MKSRSLGHNLDLSVVVSIFGFCACESDQLLFHKRRRKYTEQAQGGLQIVQLLVCREITVSPIRLWLCVALFTVGGLIFPLFFLGRSWFVRDRNASLGGLGILELFTNHILVASLNASVACA